MSLNLAEVFDRIAVSSRSNDDDTTGHADPVDAQRHAEALLRAYALLMTTHEFAVGDLVQWKPGMRSYGGLPYGGPAVVTAVEPGRVSNRDDDHDPADVRVMLVNEDAPLTVSKAWLDARRLMPFQID